jgi:hypothetical protein
MNILVNVEVLSHLPKSEASTVVKVERLWRLKLPDRMGRYEQVNGIRKLGSSWALKSYFQLGEFFGWVLEYDYAKAHLPGFWQYGQILALRLKFLRQFLQRWSKMRWVNASNAIMMTAIMMMLVFVLGKRLPRRLDLEWWHRRGQAPIPRRTLSPVATHGLGLDLLVLNLTEPSSATVFRDEQRRLCHSFIGLNVTRNATRNPFGLKLLHPLGGLVVCKSELALLDDSVVITGIEMKVNMNTPTRERDNTTRFEVMD